MPAETVLHIEDPLVTITTHVTVLSDAIRGLYRLTQDDTLAAHRRIRYGQSAAELAEVLERAWGSRG